MLVIHGTTLYGKVDQVKGLFHVATLFVHINWVPLVPTKSYLMLECSDPNIGKGGMPIKLSGKSLFFAWGRFLIIGTGCFVVPFACMLAAMLHEGLTWVILICIAVASPILSLVLFFLSYRFSQAKPERALELAALAGISPRRLAEYFAERLTEEDEDRLRNLIAEQVDSPHSP